MLRFSATIVVLVILFSAQSFTQWRWSNPVPQGNDLWSVHFSPSSTTGWAVGAAGIIVFSNNGGNSWSVQESGRDDILRGVRGVTASMAWAVGDNGVVLKTSNGGGSWLKQSSGTTAGINTIYAHSATAAWFVGDAGMLHSTTDGGQTWTARSSGTSNNLNGIHFMDAMNGVAVGSSATILQTSNGGANWTPRSVSHGMMNADLIDVFFVDGSYGWAVGSGGAVIRSTNGGTNWSRMMNNGTTADLNKVRFTDRQNGWAVGEGGALYQSTNGGGNWSAITSGTQNGIEGLALSGSKVIAVGLFGDILASANGTTFTMVTGGIRGSINAVSAAVPSSAWAVGSDGTILQSANGGATWQSLNSGSAAALYGVDNIGGQTIVACGNGGLILRSTNAGGSWNHVTSSATVPLNAVDLLDNGTGYIVGGSGRILKTTNGGAAWYTVASGTLESLFGVHFSDPDVGSVVGANGKVLSTTNGGFTWTQPQSWTQDALFHVLREGARGMMCGDDGVVSYTTDGGQSWTDCITGTTSALFHLTHPAPNEFAAVGEGGIILRTSDYGATWVREISHAMHTLYGADAHGGNVYVVGDYGTALRNASYPFPVQLRSFTAERRGDCVVLHWQSESEEALYGYTVERLKGDIWEQAGFVLPGTCTYQWNDCQTANDEQSYRLRIVDMDGTWEYSPVVTVGGMQAATTLSMQCYPQPGRSQMYVYIEGKLDDHILQIFDMRGALVTEFNSSEVQGRHLVLEQQTFPSAGNYILVLKGNAEMISKRIMVVK